MTPNMKVFLSLAATATAFLLLPWWIPTEVLLLAALAAVRLRGAHHG